jgi:signal recognition particle subunit SRP19
MKDVHNMHKQNKIILWPVYFDSARSRNEGRRVRKTLAVPSPKISEVKDAADSLHLSCELVLDVAFPQMPWLKSGMILIQKKQPKQEVLNKLAAQILKIRSTPSTPSTN